MHVIIVVIEDYLIMGIMTGKTLKIDVDKIFEFHNTGYRPVATYSTVPFN